LGRSTHVATIPRPAIKVAAVGVNLFADGLRDTMDLRSPKQLRDLR
jgi:ABC-type dipeptide/oligopeptide/nickel transport system permease subunit